MFQIYNETILDLLNLDESLPGSRVSLEDAFKTPLGEQASSKRSYQRNRIAAGGELKMRMNNQE